MLNIFSILGPSRSGKGAVLSLISAGKNFELPFASPDLDWYIDAYQTGDLTVEALSKLCVNYLFCYSWYAHLGRHTNLRPNDYSSLQKLMPQIDLTAKHNKEDKDYEFKKFLNANDLGECWNTFSWELPPEIYENIEKNYPVNIKPLFCYRSPYSLFTSWVSGNRIRRSTSLSRMFKLPSVENLKRVNLHKQFSETRNQNEMSINNEKFKFHDLKIDNVSIDKNEELQLVKFIIENKKNASYWSEKDMLYRFEHMVSDPDKFVNFLSNRFSLDFDDKLLAKGVEMMNKRPIEKLIELDIKKIEEKLNSLKCTDSTIRFIIREQTEYIKGL